MRLLYFADAWYFIALHDRFDHHHFRARGLQGRYGHGHIVTHDGVLTEMLAYFSTEGARGRAVGVQAARLALRGIEVIAPTRDLFERGLDLYAARPDKEYSLIDCMSMIIMRQQRITHVLTNDHHFRQEGFVVVSE